MRAQDFHAVRNQRAKNLNIKREKSGSDSQKTNNQNNHIFIFTWVSFPNIGYQNFHWLSEFTFLIMILGYFLEDIFMNKRVDRVAKITDKLHLIDDPQMEFCLLRSFFSLPKCNYAARTTHPPTQCATLTPLCGKHWVVLSDILLMTCMQWNQAALPVSMGGMGRHNFGNYDKNWCN